MDARLPKTERLSGATAVAALLEHGKHFQAGCLRCKYMPRTEEGPSRIVVSVPKRSFKRAVKRNLLKRRIRESYRRQKSLLTGTWDLLIVYTSREVLPYETIFADMTEMLRKMESADNKRFTENRLDENA
ncbi:MAG: ribonuclease P protein component [Candidatus Cryptobacteroides sp.]|nr:ribonuclease P protein component [Candidatus Cryptobacteroides sp.]